MVYVLLWIENLAVSLLLMATVFALVGRFRWRWMGFIIWIPLSLFIFLGYLFLSILTSIPRCPFFRNSMWFYSALALMMCFLVGLIWLCIAGVKRKKNNPIVPAANWPLFKLILAFI